MQTAQATSIIHCGHVWWIIPHTESLGKASDGLFGYQVICEKVMEDPQQVYEVLAPVRHEAGLPVPDCLLDGPLLARLEGD